jgi:hypothetical protein
MGFWLTLLYYVGVFILTELIRPKPHIEGAKPASLGDFQFPTSEEGRVVPVIWGTVRMNGPNIGWYGDFRADAVMERVQTGLFSSQNVVVGHKYHIGIDLMLCRGNLDTDVAFDEGIRRIWVDDELLFDPATFTGNGTIAINSPEFFGDDGGGIVGNLQVFPGSPGQAASTYMSGLAEIDSTLLPNYRGTAHVVLEQVYVGNQPSLRPWNFELRRIPNGLLLSTTNAVVNDGEANPANVIYDIMTNAEWGLGLTNIDTVQMAAAGVTLKTEGNGYARIMDSSQQAATILAEIEQQVDGFLVKDPATNAWQLKLIREGDYPSPVSLVPLFDETNVFELEMTRGAWADTTNQVQVQFTDTAKEYKPSFAIAQDLANKVIQSGEDIIATVVHPGVQSRTLANTLAWRDLRTLSYPLAKGKLKADRSNYDMVPGDLARINWPPYGVTDLFVRISRIQLGTDSAQEMIYDWTEDVFRTESPSFADPTDTLWTVPISDPVNITDARAFALPINYQDVNDRQQYGILAERGNGAQISYDVRIQESTADPAPSSRSGTVLDNVIAPFTPTGLLTETLGTNTIGSPTPGNYITQSFIIDSTVDISRVTESAVLADLDNVPPLAPPNVIIVDDEWMFFETLTSLGGGQYQLNNVHRGMFDTAVNEHANNAKVWFLSYGIGVLQTIPDPSTNSFDVWLLSNAVGGKQTIDIASPAPGFNFSLSITNRFQGPSAPINPKIDLVRFGDVSTAGLAFQVTWRNRFISFTSGRIGTQEDATEDPSSPLDDITLNCRIFHTGVSPRVSVFNQTAIPAIGVPSPEATGEGGFVDVSNYVVPFSPDVSPWPSPLPFAQTYTIELEAVRNGFVSDKWSHDFEVQ